jgi:hypothetical protein
MGGPELRDEWVGVLGEVQVFGEVVAGEVGVIAAVPVGVGFQPFA